ncbi:uncharacterized protein LOC141667201 isoform X2 [Apium graveolens]|uniref:uncharacterized protein LOC141667201 isoform X2 n=1 Tax=Apium graveolens TaxID=4045 RepID=UPI003D79AE89
MISDAGSRERLPQWMSAVQVTCHKATMKTLLWKKLTKINRPMRTLELRAWGGGNPTGACRQRQDIAVKKRMFPGSNSILDLGNQDQTCGCCGAMVWAAEFTGRHVGNAPKGYSICCGKGKVQLPLLRETPPELLSLLTSNGKLSRHFFSKSRVYNNMFAFCSFGGMIDDSVNKGKGPYIFRVSGQTYHNFGSLIPPDGCKPKFVQLYIYDSREAIDHRLNFSKDRDDVDAGIVATLQEMIDRENCLVGIFKQVHHKFNDVEHVPVRLRLFERRLTDGRFENLPTENDYEFAGLAVDNDLLNDRDIIAEDKRFGLKHISDLQPCFMSLQYPLLFPFGEDGFRTNIKH